MRGPDRRKITQEQTSLNLRGAIEGQREGREGHKKVQKHGGRDGGREGQERRGGGAKYQRQLKHRVVEC